jgi:hypothetical protein
MLRFERRQLEYLHVQGTFTEHSGNIQETFKEYSGNIQFELIRCPSASIPTARSTLNKYQG